MRFILAASFAVIFIATAVNAETTGTNTSCTKPFNKIMLCNLMCNLLQDSQTNEAMKTVQTKLENLIAVVNKPSPGKWLCVHVYLQIQLVKRKENARSLAWKIVLHFSRQEMTTPIGKGSPAEKLFYVIANFDIFYSCSCLFMQGAI